MQWLIDDRYSSDSLCEQGRYLLCRRHDFEQEMSKISVRKTTIDVDIICVFLSCTLTTSKYRTMDFCHFNLSFVDWMILGWSLQISCDNLSPLDFAVSIGKQGDTFLSETLRRSRRWDTEFLADDHGENGNRWCVIRCCMIFRLGSNNSSTCGMEFSFQSDWLATMKL